MAKDYFDLRSDVKFLKEFELKLFTLRKHLKTRDDNYKAQVHELVNYVESNSGRMCRLARNYAGVNREPHDWANCVVKKDDEYGYFKNWINNTNIACVEYRDIARSKAVYHFIKRIFDIPFGILEAIIGYDIRQQTTYKSWMTYIIIGAMGLYLAYQGKELIEWGVDLCKKLECLSHQ
jgi:hypothetical protein